MPKRKPTKAPATIGEKQITHARDAAIACCDAMQNLGHVLNVEWIECECRIRDGVNSAESIDAFEQAIRPALFEYLRTSNSLRRVLNRELLDVFTKARHDLPNVTACGETFTTHIAATFYALECRTWLAFVSMQDRCLTGIQPPLIRFIDKARREGVDGYDEPQELTDCTHEAWRFEYYIMLLDNVKAQRWFFMPDGWYAGIDKEWSRALAALPQGLTVSEVADKLILTKGWLPNEKSKQDATERVSRACSKGELKSSGKGKGNRRIDAESVGPWLLKQAGTEA